MGKVGIIAVIPKEYSESTAPFEASLKRNGHSRMPGTARWFFPYKELSGKYRTGLDIHSTRIKRIKDNQEKELEIKRIEESLEFIKNELGDDFDVSPRSKYYNHALRSSDADSLHVSPVKLKDAENIFNLESAAELITFSWLSDHPDIAPSFEAYRSGEYPEAQYYVKREEVEEELKYKRKQAVSKALAKLENLSVEKQRKVARMLGLGIGDTTLPVMLYNLLNDYIHKGQGSIEMFQKFADMSDDLLYTKDLLEQALYYNVFRQTRGGKVEEGGVEVGSSKEDVVEWLMTDQKELIALEQKVKAKKVIE